MHSCGLHTAVRAKSAVKAKCGREDEDMPEKPPRVLTTPVNTISVATYRLLDLSIATGSGWCPSRIRSARL